MIEKGSPKSATRKIQREQLVLPTKNISIKTFFNQKLANQHPITYLHCSNSSFRNQYNIVQNRYRTNSFIPQSAHSNDSFVQGLSAKSRAKKYWRQTANSVRFVGRMRRRSLIATVSAKPQLSKEEQIHNMRGYWDRNKLLGQSGIEMVRKQLQLKFNRTRIILKEEQKMQKYERIQSIYESKYRCKNRTKGGQGQARQMLRVQSRESNQHCSPWNRAKVEGYDMIGQLQPKYIQISQ